MTSQIIGYQTVKFKLDELGKIDTKIIQPELQKYGQDEAAALGAKQYAPERPGQRYIRTGRLGRGYVSNQPNPRQVVISNRMHYAGYVVGTHQAWMHAGRWWQAHEFVGERLPKLIGNIQRKVSGVLNG